jgi:hypothetical protein
MTATVCSCPGLPGRTPSTWKCIGISATYSLNDDGCPCERAGFLPCRGGWQEDAHTDKIHNFIDALEAIKAFSR